MLAAETKLALHISKVEDGTEKIIENARKHFREGAMSNAEAAVIRSRLELSNAQVFGQMGRGPSIKTVDRIRH